LVSIWFTLVSLFFTLIISPICHIKTNTMNDVISSPRYLSHLHVGSYTLRHCLLPTCLTANLGSSLQFGDETAGVSTRDPEGIGKK
uniref:Uncharacterized protein n=1 Tax=Scophthalmus maximus TaxID=52904 RepID=A0A8D3AQT3_SCOMX